MGSKSFHIPYGTFGELPRDITQATAGFPWGSIFRSSNPKVAKVVIDRGMRKLVFGRAGKATITILKGPRKHMPSGGPVAQAGQLVAYGKRVLAWMQVVVKKAIPIVDAFNVPSGMIVGGRFTLSGPNSPSKGGWMWGITNREVLDILDGKATVKSLGETYVVGMQMATRNYRRASVAAMFLAGEVVTTINWLDYLDPVNYYGGGTQTKIIDAATSNNPQPIKYNSQDPSLVSIEIDSTDSTKLILTYYGYGYTQLYAYQQPYDDGKIQYTDAYAYVNFTSQPVPK